MEQPLKCLVVGDGAVGKSSLIWRLYTGEFPEVYVPTVVDNSTVENRVTFWDTAGQEDYDRFRVLLYMNTDVFLVCYSVHRESSLQNVYDKWLPEVYHFCPQAVAIIVGLQNDEMEKITDPTFEMSKRWPKDKKMMKKRHLSWKIKKVLPLLKHHKNPLKPPKSCMIDGLPDEILIKIFGYLNTPDLGRVSMTCKKFNRISEDELLWRNRFKTSGEIQLNPLSPNILKTYGVFIHSHETCSAKVGKGLDHLMTKIIEASNSRHAPAKSNRFIFWK